MKIGMSSVYGESMKSYNSMLIPKSSPKKYGERLNRKNHGRNKGGKKK